MPGALETQKLFAKVLVDIGLPVPRPVKVFHLHEKRLAADHRSGEQQQRQEGVESYVMTSHFPRICLRHSREILADS